MPNRQSWNQNRNGYGNRRNYGKNYPRVSQTQNKSYQNGNSQRYGLSQQQYTASPLRSYQQPVVVVNTTPVVEEKKKFSWLGLLYSVLGLACVAVAIWITTML